MRNALFMMTAGLALPLVAFAGFEASSYKKESRQMAASAYGASAALDGNVETAWMINPEDDNIGQWIQIDVPTGKVDKVSFIAGWAKSDESWTDYSRLKSGTIQVFDLNEGEPKLVHEQKFTLEDKKDRQTVDLPDVQVGGEMNGGRVRVVIDAVQNGRDYDALAMSEMLVHLGEFEVPVFKFDTPPESTDGHDHLLMNDGNSRSYWVSKPGSETSFSLDAGSYSASSLGIQQGPKTHARPKVIEISHGGDATRYTVPDKSGVHYFEIPAIMGYTGSGVGPIEVKIVETYEGSSSQAVAIADLKLKATFFELF